jgi:hypothetical protein
MQYKYSSVLFKYGEISQMGRKRGNGRRIIMNYTGEVPAMDIR